MKILTVGRIALVKNYEVLIDAVRLFRQQGVGVDVTVVGEAALEEDKKYEKHIRQRSNFHFVGKKAQSELPEIYRSHDIFVHTSRTGSLDKALLEAMACGMKVLSCNDASRGFLPASWMFSHNDPETLVEKIRQYPNEHFNVRQYVVKHHDLKKLITKLSKLL